MHLLALAIGFGLDRLLGDPRWLPHPVVAIGTLVALLEPRLRKRYPASPEGERKAGLVMVCIVVGVCFVVSMAVISIANRIHPYLCLAVNAWLCYQMLATRSLHDAAMDVYRHLRNSAYPQARRAVGMIVGRDTENLFPPEIARAAVETVAENSSDGVIAPMLYFALGGAPLAVVYKAINTMDSMVGYKNETYLHFGSAAARLDDIANFLPARLTAWLVIAAARLVKLDWKRTAIVYARDRKAHSSPNAGHPEAAFAGALGVRLGGDSFYGGQLVHKPIINPHGRECIGEDIPRANRLLYGISWIMLGLCCLLLWSSRVSGGQGPWM